MWNALKQWWNNLFKKEVVEFKERNQTGEPIPEPSNYDLPDEGVNWEHPHDLFVQFNIINQLSVKDSVLFMNYCTKNDNAHPMSIHPVTVDIESMVELYTVAPYKTLEENHHCYVVKLKDRYGLLLLEINTVTDMIRRSVGIIDHPDHHVYLMQVMMFPVPVVEELEFKPVMISPIDLIVNYAPFDGEPDYSEPEENP